MKLCEMCAGVGSVPRTITVGSSEKILGNKPCPKCTGAKRCKACGRNRRGKKHENGNHHKGQAPSARR